MYIALYCRQCVWISHNRITLESSATGKPINQSINQSGFIFCPMHCIAALDRI